MDDERQHFIDDFGTMLDGNNQILAPSYTIQGMAYNNVGGAFGAVDTALTDLYTQIGGGLVQQDAVTRTITVGAATDGTLPPQSVWLGNLILALAGVWLMRRVNRH